MIRVAMLSFWHVHAWDYAKQALAHPETEIVAVWDEDAERGKAQAEKLTVPFYDHLDDLLARSEIDAVIVTTPTNLHHEVLCAAALAGKHIFTEKVLATTYRECQEILETVDKAGVKLIVSLPRLNDSYTLAIQEILGRQQLGELTQARTRLSHNGALGQGWLPAYFYNLQQCGGGALIDLGCHPMYLTRLFLGLPESVSASYGYVTGREVEDNAVVTLRYPNGALGIVEAGFVNSHSPFTIEVHGTAGSLLFGAPEGKLLVRSSLMEGPANERWVEYPLPTNQATAFQQWVTHIQQGTSASENIRLATDLTLLMEAANLSARGNVPVRLENITH